MAQFLSKWALYGWRPSIDQVLNQKIKIISQPEEELLIPEGRLRSVACFGVESSVSEVTV
jgi:hypothetical protein